MSNKRLKYAKNMSLANKRSHTFSVLPESG